MSADSEVTVGGTFDGYLSLDAKVVKRQGEYVLLDVGGLIGQIAVDLNDFDTPDGESLDKVQVGTPAKVFIMLNAIVTEEVRGSDG